MKTIPFEIVDVSKDSNKPIYQVKKLEVPLKLEVLLDKAQKGGLNKAEQMTLDMYTTQLMVSDSGTDKNYKKAMFNVMRRDLIEGIGSSEYRKLGLQYYSDLEKGNSSGLQFDASKLQKGGTGLSHFVSNIFTDDKSQLSSLQGVNSKSSGEPVSDVYNHAMERITNTDVEKFKAQPPAYLVTTTDVSYKGLISKIESSNPEKSLSKDNKVAGAIKIWQHIDADGKPTEEIDYQFNNKDGVTISTLNGAGSGLGIKRLDKRELEQIGLPIKSTNPLSVINTTSGSNFKVNLGTSKAFTAKESNPNLPMYQVDNRKKLLNIAEKQSPEKQKFVVDMLRNFDAGGFKYEVTEKGITMAVGKEKVSYPFEQNFDESHIVSFLGEKAEILKHTMAYDYILSDLEGSEQTEMLNKLEKELNSILNDR